jgi:lactate dehydrogenase-like 2-hydroxyacid dehydrogenase
MRTILNLTRTAQIEVNEYAMGVCLEVAKSFKEWAEKTQHDKEWMSSASQISLEMLNDYLSNTAEELAEYNYRYFQYRATALCKTWGQDQNLDPHACRMWTALCNGDSSLYLEHWGIEQVGV